MKKILRIVGGIIIVYAIVFSCNKRLSSKYTTVILSKMEKERIKSKEVNERQYNDLDTINQIDEQVVPLADTLTSVIQDEKGQGRQDKSLVKEWDEITASDVQINETTGFQPGVTTSASQIQKASQSR
jgi:hypothetical protein